MFGFLESFPVHAHLRSQQITLGESVASLGALHAQFPAPSLCQFLTYDLPPQSSETPAFCSGCIPCHWIGNTFRENWGKLGTYNTFFSSFKDWNPSNFSLFYSFQIPSNICSFVFVGLEVGRLVWYKLYFHAWNWNDCVIFCLFLNNGRIIQTSDVFKISIRLVMKIYIFKLCYSNLFLCKLHQIVFAILIPMCPPNNLSAIANLWGFSSELMSSATLRHKTLFQGFPVLKLFQVLTDSRWEIFWLGFPKLCYLF